MYPTGVLRKSQMNRRVVGRPVFAQGHSATSRKTSILATTPWDHSNLAYMDHFQSGIFQRDWLSLNFNWLVIITGVELNCLMGCDVVQAGLNLPTFRWNILPTSSWYEEAAADSSKTSHPKRTVFLSYRPENLKPHIIGILVSTWFSRKMLDFAYTYCHAEHLRGTSAVKTEYTHI
jgi:hypothetical protein